MKIQSKTRKEIRAALLLKGLSVKDFADKYGYSYETVRANLTRYLAKSQEPRGDIARSILLALEQEAGDILVQ